MVRYLKLYLFELLILSYILGNAYILVYKKDYFYPYNLLPLLIIVVYVALVNLQKLVLFLAFATPLAISLKELGMTEGMDLSLPTEPIMAGIMLLYIFNEVNSSITDRKFARHAISIIIILQLTWMFVTSLTSTEIAVSLKYLIARLWFIFSCYVIMPHLFRDRKNLVNFVLFCASGLLIVVFYTTVKHAAFNFNDKAADWVVSPFYNDHTAYGAALAMFIPACFSFLFLKNLSLPLKIYSFFLFLAFTTAIILSFARAGWLSLVVALCILVTLFLKIRFRTILLTLAVGGILFYAFQTEILIALGRNNTDAEGGFSNNIESVSNISTDASNLERLNRWSCAIRMWEDKPFFGWGPGTYMFKYAPYQLSRDRTIISTNFGTNGNAHSEYLGPLSEQGVPGLIIVLALLFYSTALGYRLIYQIKETEMKILSIGIFLGLMTYFVHGFLNNFLDTDKLSLPFWGFLAALVTIDLYYPKKEIGN
ncbi:MAG: O-antigen ligase family protein [Bacteroidetes bacterium]|nr:O-antigen ligase family protein [Bacteroidota bacterium]